MTKVTEIKLAKEYAIPITSLKKYDVVHIISNGVYDTYYHRNGTYRYKPSDDKNEFFHISTDHPERTPKNMDANIVKKYFYIVYEDVYKKYILNNEESPKNTKEETMENETMNTNITCGTTNTNTINKGIKVMNKSGESFVFSEDAVVMPENLNNIKPVYHLIIKDDRNTTKDIVKYYRYPNDDELIFEIVKAGGTSVIIEERKELTYNTMHHYVWGTFFNGIKTKEYCWENTKGLTINVGDIVKVENHFGNDSIKVTRLEDSYVQQDRKPVLAVNEN